MELKARAYSEFWTGVLRRAEVVRDRARRVAAARALSSVRRSPAWPKISVRGSSLEWSEIKDLPTDDLGQSGQFMVLPDLTESWLTGEVAPQKVVAGRPLLPQTIESLRLQASQMVPTTALALSNGLSENANSWTGGPYAFPSGTLSAAAWQSTSGTWSNASNDVLQITPTGTSVLQFALRKTRLIDFESTVLFSAVTVPTVDTETTINRGGIRLALGRQYLDAGVEIAVVKSGGSWVPVVRAFVDSDQSNTPAVGTSILLATWGVGSWPSVSIGVQVLTEDTAEGQRVYVAAYKPSDLTVCSIACVELPWSFTGTAGLLAHAGSGYVRFTTPRLNLPLNLWAYYYPQAGRSQAEVEVRQGRDNFSLVSTVSQERQPLDLEGQIILPGQRRVVLDTQADPGWIEFEMLTKPAAGTWAEISLAGHRFYYEFVANGTADKSWEVELPTGTTAEDLATLNQTLADIISGDLNALQVLACSATTRTDSGSSHTLVRLTALKPGSEYLPGLRFLASNRQEVTQLSTVLVEHPWTSSMRGVPGLTLSGPVVGELEYAIDAGELVLKNRQAVDSYYRVLES